MFKGGKDMLNINVICCCFGVFVGVVVLILVLLICVFGGGYFDMIKIGWVGLCLGLLGIFGEVDMWLVGVF